jgi:hypothetical protein
MFLMINKNKNPNKYEAVLILPTISLQNLSNILFNTVDLLYLMRPCKL